jgi:hypothetical protein
VAAPLRERGCCQRVYRRYRHRYRKTQSAATAFDITSSENRLAFSLNDHKHWAFEHDFCGVALFLMFAPGFRHTDTALSTISAVTSTDRSWPGARICPACRRAAVDESNGRSRERSPSWCYRPGAVTHRLFAGPAAGTPDAPVPASLCGRWAPQGASGSSLVRPEKRQPCTSGQLSCLSPPK